MLIHRSQHLDSSSSPKASCWLRDRCPMRDLVQAEEFQLCLGKGTARAVAPLSSIKRSLSQPILYNTEPVTGRSTNQGLFSFWIEKYFPIQVRQMNDLYANRVQLRVQQCRKLIGNSKLHAYCPSCWHTEYPTGGRGPNECQKVVQEWRDILYTLIW